MKKETANLGKLRNEINSFKNELTNIRKEKENWFKEKEELKKQIFDLINKIKTIKNEKDSFNIVFCELRENRDKLNQKVKSFVQNIKKLRRDRKDLVKKLGIKLTPDKIKQKIKLLDEKIETEVLSLKKEEKLMDEKKALKKILNESKVVLDLDEKINSISKFIEQTKTKAQDYHLRLKEHLKKHRKSRSYKDFINLSKQINFLKSSQQKAFNMFIDFKNRFISLNKLLGHKLFQERRIKGELENKKVKFEEEKKKKEEILLDKKYKQVEEKLKTKKKLTTDDLLSVRK